MKILALESSAVACSVCLWEDGRLLAQSFQNSGLTHSRTLMSLCGDLLKNGGYTLDEVDVVAVAAGPGSFTGLRIGVAAAKGWPGRGTSPARACPLWRPWPGPWRIWRGPTSAPSWTPGGSRSTTPCSRCGAARCCAGAPTGP